MCIEYKIKSISLALEYYLFIQKTLLILNICIKLLHVPINSVSLPITKHKNTKP